MSEFELTPQHVLEAITISKIETVDFCMTALGKILKDRTVFTPNDIVGVLDEMLDRRGVLSGELPVWESNE